MGGRDLSPLTTVESLFKAGTLTPYLMKGVESEGRTEGTGDGIRGEIQCVKQKMGGSETFLL